MRAVVQRVSRAEVRVEGQAVGVIGRGLLAYVGSAVGDGPQDVQYVAEKIANLRVFQDDNRKMNLSVRDVGGGVLVVPAFTTMADARQGRRPAFVHAAAPESAEPAYQEVVAALRAAGVTVQTGRFRETMEVDSVNDGPICVLLDSTKLF
ncbi:MAG: D-aminoacyl-tRNA deacylase [Phycisphaerae bacterium]|nr:D-aminoacyl-tRNA deacylase [Phycisphaerae bacterium]